MGTWARPVVAWEIRARDAAAMRAFYETMFEWEIDSARIPGISFVAPGVGAPEMGLGGVIMPSAEQPGVTLLIQVADLRGSMAQAEQLGGKILAQPFDVPGGPTIARIADPEGNQIGLVQM